MARTRQNVLTRIGDADFDDDVAPHPLSPETVLVVEGRDRQYLNGFVNPPIVRGSTVLYPTADDLRNDRGTFHYGREGTPTTVALTDALTALEGPLCAGVALLPSGLAALSTALLSILKSGDHLLVTDSVYRPTRRFCDGLLKRFGVETSYYDPLVGAAIDRLFRPNTRAVLIEAPGSQTFEMPDTRAIADVARSRNALVVADNTWATPLYFRALDHGVDLSVQAATKYIGGHSDIMFGTISASAAVWPVLSESVRDLGQCAGPDDVFLALRGLRTMAVRLAHHQASGIAIAKWLRDHPAVERVLHPALESDPGHAIWTRDFKGASGLFSVILKPVPDMAVDTFLDALRLFGMGYSWGGFESLVIPFDCTTYRTATQWSPAGPALRFHIGLENLDDLRADLTQAFDKMASRL